MNIAYPTDEQRNEVVRFLPMFVIATILMAVKSPGSLTVPQLWAEDGVVFFAQQYGHAVPEIFTPYAGYLHAIPRLVAYLASAFNPMRIPTVYNAAALLISASCVVYVTRRFDRYVPASVVFLSFFLVPTGGEIFGTLTNVQWFTQIALIAACIIPSTAQGRIAAVATFLLVLVLALTGPFSVLLVALLVPLYAVAWLAGRARWLSLPLMDSCRSICRELSHPRLCALGIGALVQIFILMTNTQRVHHNSPPISQLLTVTFGEIVPLHIFGQDFLTTTAWLIIEALLVVGIITRPDAGWEKRLTLVIIVVLASVVALAGTLSSTFDSFQMFGFGDRYFYFVKIAFWWAACFSLTRKGNVDSRQMESCIIGAMVFFAILNPLHLQRKMSPDLHWKEQVMSLSQPGYHEIMIPPSWTIHITTEPKRDHQ